MTNNVFTFKIVEILPGLVVSATQKSCNGLGSNAKARQLNVRATKLNKRIVLAILNWSSSYKFALMEEIKQEQWKTQEARESLSYELQALLMSSYL